MNLASVRKQVLAVPASLLAALGWLPIGILGIRSSLAATAAEPNLKSPLPVSGRYGPLMPGSGLAARAAGAGDPFIDQPLAGPTGPTGYAASQGLGCCGSCEVADFSSVSCATATSCTAVGDGPGNRFGLGGPPLAEGWDGTTWSIEPMPTPNGSTSTTVGGVSCTATTSCLAVGYYYTLSSGARPVPLAETWNGSRWTIRAPPIPSGATSTSFAYVQCASASACMVVGSYETSSNRLPLAELWDGAVWTILSAPLPSGASGGALSAVSCPSTAACTAVGAYDTPTGGPNNTLTLAETWDGSSWSIQPTPNPTGSGASTLRGVWCESATSCIAVGGSSTQGGGESMTLVESWNGTSWTIQPSPNPSGSTNSGLVNVSCAASGVPCKAVGASYYTPLVESWDGTSWTIASTPSPASSDGTLSDVSCTSGTACTAVGQYVTGTGGAGTDSFGQAVTLAERWDGTNWTIQPTPDPPLALTDDATNTTATSVTLNGFVNPNGATVTNCYFEYGTSTPYTSTVPCAQSVGGGTSAVSVSADVSGLAPNTGYSFDLVATNAWGPAQEGFGSSFTTSGGNAPTATTEGATTIASSSATLNGSANANGATVTSCYFEYGSTTSYGSSVPCAQSVGSGASPVSVSAVVSGLTAATTYHYQLVIVTNGNGTGYGGDQSFATAGTALPAVVTGYAFTSWPDSATLTGTINPHGHSVTYWFTYGEFSEPADPSLYPLQSSTGTLSGTSDISISVSINNLASYITYYYRLWVRSDDGTLIPGNEVSLKIGPPEPQVVDPPSLQIRPKCGLADVLGIGPCSGFGQFGFVLKCNSGNWADATGPYKYDWVFVEANNVTVPANSNETFGDEYIASLNDVGAVIQCVVTPHQLDGSLVSSGQPSDSFLDPPPTGPYVVPFWLKQFWGLLDVVSAVQDGGDAILECAESADIPGIGAALCVALIAQQALGNPFEDMLHDATDPPDAHYRDVALPKPLPQAQTRYPCPRRLARRACSRLGARAAAYAHATEQVASVLELLAISRNRTLIAKTKHDSNAEAVQAAARKAYAALLANALAAQLRAGIAYARELRRDRIDVKTPAKSLKLIAKRPLASIIGLGMLNRMLRDGYPRSDINRSFKHTFKHIRNFDLQRFLTKSTLPIPFERYADTIDLADVTVLIGALTQQHALSIQTAELLLNDLDQARAACTPRSRTHAMTAFLTHAASDHHRQSVTLLRAAAQPLADGASTGDPYPKCFR